MEERPWGTTCYPSSPVGRKQAPGRRMRKASCPSPKSCCSVCSSDMPGRLEFCPGAELLSVFQTSMTSCPPPTQPLCHGPHASLLLLPPHVSEVQASRFSTGRSVTCISCSNQNKGEDKKNHLQCLPCLGLTAMPCSPREAKSMGPLGAWKGCNLYNLSVSPNLSSELIMGCLRKPLPTRQGLYSQKVLSLVSPISSHIPSQLLSFPSSICISKSYSHHALL